MQLSAPTSSIAALSPALLGATIDYLAALRPAPDIVATVAITFAMRLDYDDEVALALAARVCAAQRLFRHPLWPVVRRIGDHIAPEDRSVYQAIIIGFIATAPLDPTRGLAPETLIEALLRRLPAAGHG